MKLLLLLLIFIIVFLMVFAGLCWVFGYPYDDISRGIVFLGSLMCGACSVAAAQQDVSDYVDGR